VDTVVIVIEVEDGIATITDLSIPPGLTVRAIIRDYDTDGSDPSDLDLDGTGRACFESIVEYHTIADEPGFI
jgi:hypothetical protein